MKGFTIFATIWTSAFGGFNLERNIFADNHAEAADKLRSMIEEEFPGSSITTLTTIPTSDIL